MCADDPSTEDLLRRAGQGDRGALDQLFARHRHRLRQMVAVRMDRRLASRLDPSDVVQETLAEAADRLLDYLQQRPAPFYLWLRQLAWQRLIGLSRRHIGAQRRSVDNEAAGPIPLSDESVMELASRLVASGTSPSGRVQKDEMRSRVRAALARLPPVDREVLVLRYLEQLSTDDVARVLGIGQRAVRSRHRHALESLRELLGDVSPEGKEE